MRCKFCGFDNPEDKITCEKCGNTLSASRPIANYSGDNYDRPTQRKDTKDFDPKATIRETDIEAIKAQSKSESQICPVCGYQLESGNCANCGYDANKSKTLNEAQGGNSDIRKTIRPIRKVENEGSFTLTPISEVTGEPEGEEISYKGNTVSLNRDNTAPNNNTITSTQQASLQFENGEWSIEDKSEYRTTFIQISRPIVLKSGDLILLGNQLYRFDC